MKINIKLFLLFISIILISSCSDYRKILKTPGFEKKLEAALEYYEEKELKL